MNCQGGHPKGLPGDLSAFITSSVQDPQRYWLQKLRQRNPRACRAKGYGAARFALNKPVPLLALLDHFAEQCEVAVIGPRFALSAALRARFPESWAGVVGRWSTKPRIRLPFYHLSSQEFRKPLRADWAPSAPPGPIGLLPKDYQTTGSPLELGPQ